MSSQHQVSISSHPHASSTMVQARRRLVFTIGLLGLCLTHNATAAPDDSRLCSERTLKGTYLYEMIGRDRIPDGATNAGPYAEIGQDYFNGSGGVVTYISSSRDDHVPLTGTYTLERNCEGTITYALEDGSSRVQRIYAGPGGQRLSFVEVTDESGPILAGERQRVAPNRPSAQRCSVRTLKGTYIYNNNGAVMVDQTLHLIREAGMESYDGRGRLINRYTDSFGTHDTIAGSYAVTPSCHGTAEYESGGLYRFYADPQGRSFVFVDATPGSQRAGRTNRVSLQQLVKE